MSAKITSDYRVDPEDERLQAVEDKYDSELSELNDAYSDRITEAENFYQGQSDALDASMQTQTDIQNQQTDFAIQQIEQKKDQAEADYKKEQSAAYVDYQKQSDPYGVNAERMAANGLQNSGYSESSQVRMYTAYQNRVAVAREAISRTKLEYDNAITSARLQNNASLAQIALETYKKKMEIALAGFQYKNTLLDQQEQAKNNLEQRRQQSYRDTLDQILQENAAEENARQFNEEMDFKREQAELNSASNADDLKTSVTKKMAGETFRKPEHVREFLNENGISTAGIEIKTRKEWRNAKKNNEEDGAYNQKNYREYLKMVVEWVISQL